MRLKCGTPLAFPIKLLTPSLWILRTGSSPILKLVSAACRVSLGPPCFWLPYGSVGNGAVRKFLISTSLLLPGPTFRSSISPVNGWWLTDPGTPSFLNMFLNFTGLLPVLAGLRLAWMVVVWVSWALLVLVAS